MENTQINTEKKGKINIPMIIFAIVLIVGFFYVQKCSSEKHLIKFAKKELSTQGYEAIDISIVKSTFVIRNSSASGIVQFVVKDHDGNTFNGKGSIKKVRKNKIMIHRAFTIEELNPE